MMVVVNDEEYVWALTEKDDVPNKLPLIWELLINEAVIAPVELKLPVCCMLPVNCWTLVWLFPKILLPLL
jgi:hypothetical protein